MWGSRARWGEGTWGWGGQAGQMPPAAQGPGYKSRPVRSPSRSWGVPGPCRFCRSGWQWWHRGSTAWGTVSGTSGTWLSTFGLLPEPPDLGAAQLTHTCTHTNTYFFHLLLVLDLQADNNIWVFQIFQRNRSHENERNITFGNKNYNSTHHLKEKKFMYTFRFLLAAMYIHIWAWVCADTHSRTHT